MNDSYLDRVNDDHPYAWIYEQYPNATDDEIIDIIEEANDSRFLFL